MNIPAIADRPAITEMVYYVLLDLRSQLYDEIHFKLYTQGKGKPGSPAKALRVFGFREKLKDKLLKALTIYLQNVEVIRTHKEVL